MKLTSVINLFLLKKLQIIISLHEACKNRLIPGRIMMNLSSWKKNVIKNLNNICKNVLDNFIPL
jgi:hypothetical protein